MSVIMHEEVGFSPRSGAVYSVAGAGLSAAEMSKPIKDVKDATLQPSSAEWAEWGQGNNRPEKMRQHIINCGVLSAGIDAKTRMAIGKGIEPFLLVNVDSEGKEELEWVNDKEIHDWLELNNNYAYSYATVRNMLAYGWAPTQIMMNKERTAINRIKAADTYMCRLEKKDPSTFRILNMYMCSDWSRFTSYNPENIKKIPVLDEGYELQDLLDGKGLEYAVLHRLLKNGEQYYPQALWEAAEKWIEVSKAVPDFKNALHKNSMNIKYLIEISTNYWKSSYKEWDTYTDDKKKQVRDEVLSKIDTWLVGNERAGKSMYSSKRYDPITQKETSDITITPITDNMKDGKLLPDSAAADKQIMFSMFLNPAIWGGNLLGDGASGGAGSGSDIREAFLVQMMLMHVERSMNLKVFDIVKRFNGWSERHETDTKRLVFRYKSGLLTTLDTGKSTAPVAN